MLGANTVTWATSKKVSAWEMLADRSLETHHEYVA
jgi:hypothetical protein